MTHQHKIGHSVQKNGQKQLKAFNVCTKTALTTGQLLAIWRMESQLNDGQED